MKHQYCGIRRILEAFKNSFDGFLYAVREEEAFRQDLVICGILFIALFFLPVCFMQKLILCSGMFFVLFAELTNSAIEACIDRISPEWHKLSKAAKDIGSLLVFISFCWLILVWTVVLFNLYK